MRAKSVLRIRIITTGILILALLLLARLYQLQVIQVEAYRDRAEAQYVDTVQDIFTRGSIYFTTKNEEEVSAATVQMGYLLALNPKQIVNHDEVFTALSGVLEIDRETFMERAQKENRTYVELVREVPNEQAHEIEKLDIAGIQLYRNQWRYYPGGELAARTVGFIGYEGDELSGRYGLERYYNGVLERENEKLSVNFFAEIFSNLGNLVFDNTDADEGDLVTSIEPTVARTLQHELQQTHTEWGSVLTGGVIIDPRSGQIYALDAVPTFDLNDRSGVDIHDFRNPLVEDVYEMGSIIKPLTMAAGLDVGAVTPQTTYYDAGFIEMNTARINNYDGRGRGYVNMQEVLNQSLNTGVAFVVKEMGKEVFREYLYDFQLDSETGIDIPGEIHGLTENLNSPRDLEYATASFGQGIALTPIATVRALSALANGGKLITPHIVKRIEYENGRVHEVGFPDGDRVLSEETSETITRMLVTVVDDALRGGEDIRARYTIAAKTGTAQIADEVNGGYYEDRFLHSFFGYFPAYDPQFLVFLYTVEPQGVRYASETLTDPFMNITDFLINYYDIPPDR